MSSKRDDHPPTISHHHPPHMNPPRVRSEAICPQWDHPTERTERIGVCKQGDDFDVCNTAEKSEQSHGYTKGVSWVNFAKLLPHAFTLTLETFLPRDAGNTVDRAVKKVESEVKSSARKAAENIVNEAITDAKKRLTKREAKLKGWKKVQKRFEEGTFKQPATHFRFVLAPEGSSPQGRRPLKQVENLVDELIKFIAKQCGWTKHVEQSAVFYNKDVDQNKHNKMVEDLGKGRMADLNRALGTFPRVSGGKPKGETPKGRPPSIQKSVKDWYEGLFTNSEWEKTWKKKVNTFEWFKHDLKLERILHDMQKTVEPPALERVGVGFGDVVNAGKSVAKAVKNKAKNVGKNMMKAATSESVQEVGYTVACLVATPVFAGVAALGVGVAVVATVLGAASDARNMGR